MEVHDAEVELCSIINHALRSDSESLLRHAVPITRSINKTLCQRRADAVDLPFPPEDGIVWRCGGLPDKHRNFFVVRWSHRHLCGIQLLHCSPPFLARHRPVTLAELNS